MNSIYNSFTRMAMPELEGKHLFIPEYQRGYRWQERQIMQLLSDLNDFRTNSPRDSFYCLQPIVVKPCDAQTIVANGLDEKMTWYEVIDGQQRLTTLHLIMTFSQLTRKVEHLLMPLPSIIKRARTLAKYSVISEDTIMRRDIWME